MTGHAIDDASDLLAAAVSSTGFWDNPIDDEVWNDAACAPDGATDCSHGCSTAEPVDRAY